MRRTLTTALLSASSLIAAGRAQAQEAGDGRIEDRVEALEAKLDAILERLDEADATLGAEEVEVIEEAQTLISPPPERPDFGEPTREEVLEAALERLEGFQAGETEVIFGGYVKLDASVTEFTGGELPSNSLGRDFYIPALIPVGGEESDPVFDINPRETRFLFGLGRDVAGHEVTGKIEFDFQVTNDGNERVSNSFTPRMRQAFLTIDNWLFGQAWTTFQDVAALPDNLDFIGPTEGTVFIRQPMIRYTNGPFQIAIEQPETEVTLPGGGRFLPGDDPAPDLVLRYNEAGDWGHLTLAGLARLLTVDDVQMGTDEEAFGWGVSASGKIMVGPRDDFRFMATYGDGVGRYIGVNIVNDVALAPDGDLETIRTVSGFASYRHFWSPKWRSNATLGYFEGDNPVELTGDAVTETVYSVHANLIYSLAPQIDLGVEYIHASRELENGADGAMNKLQFSAKYGF